MDHRPYVYSTGQEIVLACHDCPNLLVYWPHDGVDMDVLVEQADGHRVHNGTLATRSRTL
jgi:hypothetical protein